MFDLLSIEQQIVQHVTGMKSDHSDHVVNNVTQYVATIETEDGIEQFAFSESPTDTQILAIRRRKRALRKLSAIAKNDIADEIADVYKFVSIVQEIHAQAASRNIGTAAQRNAINTVLGNRWTALFNRLLDWNNA